jgi:hypothetical protein
MRRLIFLFVVFMIPLAADAGKPSLDERLDAGGIVKDIKIPKEEQWAYVYVQAVIKSKPETVWLTLADIDSWPSWLPMTRRAWFLSPEASSKITPEAAKNRDDILEINSEHPPGAAVENKTGRWQRVAYEEYDLPWPLKNEWVVRRYDFNDENGLKRAAWRKITSTDGRDDGYWEIKNWKDGKTHLTYYYRIKKKNVPDSLFRTAVSFTVNSMIKALRHESAKREKRG